MINQLKINHIGISVHVNYADISGAEPTTHNFNDSVSLNFQDEADLDRALKEKPHFAAVLPKLIKRLINSHDPENKDAKKLLKDLGI
ncbi:hypothetical protein [Dyadobacter sp. Leaf189]|uniref:hypothetical protein n=1 Tax=Dyadobacter sp. Leaf189 TaxID=1736295 RepID=UPI0006FA8C67|nr:hypothetical protein [Dyadobacter sp. Leaf189]KQS33978.1 hypothetical protein ASG33_08075 [Dyadobacter sp. Leaf189]